MNNNWIKNTLRALILQALMLANHFVCFAQTDFTVDNIIYKVISDQTVSVVGGGARIVDIPDSVAYGNKKYRVIGIEAEAFKDNTTIRAVNFPKNLDYIKKRAFSGCVFIPEITLGKVGHIYEEAFEGCCSEDHFLNHSTVFIEQVDTMDMQTGLGANNLVIEKGGDIEGLRSNNYINQVTIGRRSESASVYGVGNYDGSNLATINFPVEPFGIGQYNNCLNLDNLKIPSYVDDIGSGTFKGCRNLKRVYIEDSKNRLTLGLLSGLLGPDVTFASSPIEEMYVGRKLVANNNKFLSDNTTLSEVTFGENVEIPYGFNKSLGITKINVPWVDEEFINSGRTSDCFNSKTFSDAKLCVPQGTKTMYETSKGFLAPFKHIEEVLGEKLTWNQENATVINVGETLELTAKGTYPVVYKIINGDDDGTTAQLVKTENGYGIKALNSGAVSVMAKQDGGWGDWQYRYFIIKGHKQRQIMDIEGPTKSMIGEYITLKVKTSSGLPLLYDIMEGEEGNVWISRVNGDYVLYGKKSGRFTIGMYQQGNDDFFPAYKSWTIDFEAKPLKLSLSSKYVEIGDSVLISASSTDESPLSYEIVEGYAYVVEKEGKYYVVGQKTGDVTVRAKMPDSDHYDKESLLAKVTVTRKTPQISWVGSTDVSIGDTIAVRATVSSQLPLTYEMNSGSQYADFFQKDGAYYLVGKKRGRVYIKATQEGDDTYYSESSTCGYTVKGFGQTITLDEDNRYAEPGDTILLEASVNTGLPLEYSVFNFYGEKDCGKVIKKDGNSYLVIFEDTKPNSFVVVRVYQVGNEQYESKSEFIHFDVRKLIGQTIIWGQSTEVPQGGSMELCAMTSSNLPVRYKIVEGLDCAELIESDGTFFIKGIKEGMVTVKAFQIGSDTYKEASLQKVFNVTDSPLKSQTIVWNQQASSLTVGESISLSAKASSELPIVYRITKGNDIAELLEKDGECLLHGQKKGVVTVVATQLGNKEYASTSAALQFNVNGKEQTIKWELTSNSLAVGETLMLNATTNSGLQINYVISSGSRYAEIVPSGKGYALKGLAEGTVIVVASQDGDDIYTAAQNVTMQFFVLKKRKRTQTITWNQTIELTEGATIEMQAYASSGLPVTYTYSRPEGAFRSPSISGSSITFPESGAYVIYASQNGNDTYEPADAVKMEFNVLPENYDDLMYIDGIYYRYADDQKTSLRVVMGYKKYEGDIVVPSNVNGLPIVKIDTQAFYASYGVKSIVIGENVVSTGYEALGACRNMTSVTLPADCSFAGYTFNASPSMREIHCHAQIPYVVDDALFNGNVNYNTCVLYVPYGTKERYAQAEIWKNFATIVEEKWKQSQAITWNQTMEFTQGATIEMQAHASSGLPVTYTYSQPEGAFRSPRISGSNITFPESGAYILYASQNGNDTYEPADAVKLEFNVLPENYDDLMYIDGIYYRYADDQKTSLRVVMGYKKYEGDIVVPSNVNGLPVVKIEAQAFYASYGVKSIVIGENVVSTGYESLGACRNMTSVTLPTDCSLARYTFNASPSMREIHCHAQIPYVVDDAVFNGEVNYNTCVLYVPYGTKERYAQAEIWKNFANIVEETVTSVSTVKNEQTYDAYTLQGVKVLNKSRTLNMLPDGIYIVNGHKMIIHH